MDHLRYLLPASFFTVTGLGVFYGGGAVWIGLALFPTVALIEYFLKDDLHALKMSDFSGMLILYLQLIAPVFLWYSLWVFLGTDYTWLEWTGASLSTSLITAAVGLPIAHELFHKNGKIPRFLGNLLGVTLMAGDIEMEHKIGHHIETSSALDVDTPYRGENLYTFIPRLMIFFHTSPWKLEKKRFATKGKSHWSFANRILWAWFGFALLVAFFAATDGWFAACTVVLISVVGQSIASIFSYVQHYGLIRLPNTPIEKRHAFNHIRPLSRPLTMEIVTHSEHHTDPTVPYWKLTPYEDVIRPGSAYGYFLLTLVPPLWHKRMREHLKEWDEKYASEDELKLAKEANIKAGWI